MGWVLFMAAAAFIAWKLASGPSQPETRRNVVKEKEKENGLQPEVASLNSSVTLTIETTGGLRPFTSGETAEYAMRMAATDERERNAIPWCKDASIHLPIKALTGYQWHCLREARLRYQIVPKYMDGAEYVALEDSREWPQRTINSLVKHGMLELGDSGTYRITDIGLRALEKLPTKS